VTRATEIAKELGAEFIASTAAILPTSGRTVQVATFLRIEERSPVPVDRTEGCWAPNKPAILVGGRPTWAEFSIVRALEPHGWEGRWIKNWAGGREFCIDVGESRPFPPQIGDAFAAIHARAASLRGSGSWDVLSWRDDDILFIESKKHRSGDRLRPSQLTWMEAALDLGHEPERFLIVEYQLAGSSQVGQATPRLMSQATPHAPGLALALAAAAGSDAMTRITHRDALVSFGTAAVQPVADWLRDDDLRRLAIVVLEKLAVNSQEAARALRDHAATEGPDSDLALAALGRLAPRVQPTKATPTPAADLHVSDGRPPRAQGPCDVLNPDGSACGNPGRWPVSEGWSCTTHYKARVRRGLA
jgi:hypothetical protein